MSFAPIPEDCGYNIETLNRQLDRAKTAAFLNSSGAFLGPLMCGMDFIWTLDVETAATDGIHVWWNPKDFTALSDELRVSTVIHELYHPANLHFVRIGDRDPNIWNIACDIDINNNMRADGYVLEKPYFIWDDAYINWAVEDIYAKKKQEDECAPRGPGSQGEPGPKGGTNGKDMVPAMSPQDTQRAINNVVQAAHTAIASGNPGSVPGHIQLIIKKFLNPIVPWHILFDRFFEDRCNDDYSYSRPNRRFSDIYMPSLQSDERLTHIIFYEDVSGSVSNEQCRRFNSEVKYIKEKYNPEKLTIVQFDHEIQSEKTILEDDPFDEVVIVGRGGTCLKPVREHMMLHKPTAAVVFSDLEVRPMEPGPTCPILWVAVGNENATVPFGQLIHIKG